MRMDMRLLLEKIQAAADPHEDDLVRILRSESESETAQLLAFADEVRRNWAGPGILLRGIVEFSSFCRNACAYCGLNRNNLKLTRYRMEPEEILDTAAEIHAAGLRTVVLQSGEDDQMETGWLSDLIRRIKSRFDTAVTLAVGERPREDYREWKAAGADRYLLKIESTDPKLYAQLHPGMKIADRFRCLNDLRELGYQTGTGNIVGLKGQSLESLARDIRFFKKGRFAMLGIGPFIPHPITPLSGEGPGNMTISLRVLALTRIVTRAVHLPATTAVASLETGQGWEGALGAGANVIMPNFTPAAYKRLYDIYPGRRGHDRTPARIVEEIALLARRMGRTLDFSRGDAPADIAGNNSGARPEQTEEE
jgi:biotin synthase